MLFLRCSPSLHLFFPWRFVIPLTTIRHCSHPVFFMAFLIIVPVDILGFLGGASGKELSCQCRRCWRYRFNPCVRKIPCRREWLPTPVFLPGEFHEQRRVGYSPWCCKESDMTERLNMHATFLRYLNEFFSSFFTFPAVEFCVFNEH